MGYFFIAQVLCSGAMLLCSLELAMAKYFVTYQHYLTQEVVVVPTEATSILDAVGKTAHQFDDEYWAWLTAQTEAEMLQEFEEWDIPF